MFGYDCRGLEVVQINSRNEKKLEMIFIREKYNRKLDNWKICTVQNCSKDLKKSSGMFQSEKSRLKQTSYK